MTTETQERQPVVTKEKPVSFLKRLYLKTPWGKINIERGRIIRSEIDAVYMYHRKQAALDKANKLTAYWRGRNDLVADQLRQSKYKLKMAEILAGNEQRARADDNSKIAVGVAANQKTLAEIRKRLDSVVEKVQAATANINSIASNKKARENKIDKILETLLPTTGGRKRPIGSGSSLPEHTGKPA